MQNAQLSPSSLFGDSRAQALADMGSILAGYHKELRALDERAVKQKFSIGRLLRQIQMRQGFEGVEEEIIGAASLLAGEKHVDPDRVWVPFGAMARALSTVPGSKGGYLAGVDTLAPVDVLRPWSVVASAGVSMLNNLRGNVALPRDTASPSITWMAAEGGSGPSESPPSLGEASLQQRTAMALVQFSLQFVRQAESAEAYLQRRLIRAVGEALDVAALAGAGANQPLGLLQTTGIGTQSGTSLAHAGILAMRRIVLNAGAREDALTWVGTPAVQETLGARERATGGGKFLWDEGGILGKPAYATKNAPANALIVGDFTQAVVGLYGPGIRIDVDPSQNFNSAGLVMRVMLMCDVAFPQPAAFCVATSIT